MDLRLWVVFVIDSILWSVIISPLNLVSRSHYGSETNALATGFPQAIGTFQAYLQENQLSEYATRDLGWISGLYTALTLFLGIQAGPIIDRFSPMVVGPIATALTIPMFFLLAECTEYWHFTLCLGILGGIGGALASTIALSIVGKLFTRLRGLAIGLALNGSALGGRHNTIHVERTVSNLGLHMDNKMYNLRIRNLQTNITRQPSNVSDASVTPCDPARKSGASAAINFNAFRSQTFAAVAATFFLLEFVIFGTSGSLPTLSLQAGNSVETGYNFIAIINGSGCVGRIVSGLLGDKYGHCNTLFLAIVLTAICVGATLVPFGGTQVSALYAFATLWGLGSGFFSALIPACLGETCGHKDYGQYLGTLNFTVSFALLITVPIGGQMLQTLGGQALAGLYVGVLCIAAFGIYITRSLLVNSWTSFQTRV
ncbi:hypothetical protein NW765_013659 [Fusarium oxysporum]|nr:hypothetical protein NW765_013659 [Fusarium oxysporum]